MSHDHPMKLYIVVFTLSLLLSACSGLQKKSALNPYDSASSERIAQFKRVALPFQAGTQFTISQGAFGTQSHSEIGNEYSWDFDVPFGTNVVAVESGKVLSVWQPHTGGGCESRYSAVAHNLKIEHTDGTVAQYVHIETELKKGAVVLACLLPTSQSDEWVVAINDPTAASTMHKTA